MNSVQRPGSITFIFVVNLIMALIAVALTVGVLNNTSVLYEAARTAGASVAQVRHELAVGLMIGLSSTLVLIAVMCRQNWARWLYIAFCAYHIVKVLIEFCGTQLPMPTYMPGSAVSGAKIGLVIGLLWGIIQILILLSAASNDYFRNENEVTFRDIVDSMPLSKRQIPSDSAQVDHCKSSDGQPAPDDIAVSLNTLQELLNQDLISKTDFDQKRKELLDRI